MKLTIHKGKRRPAGWWKMLRLWHCKKSITMLVMFDTSARYFLPAADQADTNKLFGLGFFWNRKHSARFCWNWNHEYESINLFAYFHRAGMKDSLNVNGEMDFIKLAELKRNVWYKLTIQIKPDKYKFTSSNPAGNSLYNTVEVPKGHNKKWSYWLGPYFGGTRKAPHDIHFEMKNV